MRLILVGFMPQTVLWLIKALIVSVILCPAAVSLWRGVLMDPNLVRNQSACRKVQYRTTSTESPSNIHAVFSLDWCQSIACWPPVDGADQLGVHARVSSVNDALDSRPVLCNRKVRTSWITAW